MITEEMRLEQTIEILKTPPAQRTELKLNILQKETSQIGLFKTLIEEEGDDQLHRLCCMYMKHEFLRKDQAVFNIDDVGTKFYIIISGIVGVYIRMPTQKKPEVVIEENGQVAPLEEPLTKVKELTSGDSFGELALLKNQKRLASIICVEDCHFGIIDKKIFNLALKEKEEEKLNLQMIFLTKSPLFSRVPKNSMKILHTNAFYVKYLKGQHVYQEGQYPNACYIIRSGEFTIYKKVNHFFKGYEMTNQYYNNNNAQRQIEIKLRVLGQGELFGETEIIMNEVRQTSAVCTSLEKGELMIINRSDMETKVLNEEERKDQFEQYVAKKNDQIEDRIRGILGSLQKYQSFRFKTGAQKGLQLELCEQIKNKEKQLDPIAINELLESYGQLEIDDQVGVYQPKKILYKPNNDQQRQSTNAQKLSLNTSLDEDEGQINNEKRNYNQKINKTQQYISEKEQIPTSLLLERPKTIQQTRRNSQTNAEQFESKTPEYSKHITKNSHAALFNKFFGKKEMQDESKKKAAIQRVELNSYTTLKDNIRKKTAVALSKQYRLPYEQFMNLGNIYGMSQGPTKHQSQHVSNQKQDQQQRLSQTSQGQRQYSSNLHTLFRQPLSANKNSLHLNTIPKQEKEQLQTTKDQKNTFQCASEQQNPSSTYEENQNAKQLIEQPSEITCEQLKNYPFTLATSPEKANPSPLSTQLHQQLQQNQQQFSFSSNSNKDQKRKFLSFSSYQQNTSLQSFDNLSQKIKPNNDQDRKDQYSLHKDLIPSQSSQAFSPSAAGAFSIGRNRKQIISLKNASFLFEKSQKNVPNKTHSRLHNSSILQAQQQKLMTGSELFLAPSPSSNKQKQFNYLIANNNFNSHQEMNLKQIPPVLIGRSTTISSVPLSSRRDRLAENKYASTESQTNNQNINDSNFSSLMQQNEQQEDKNIHMKFYSQYMKELEEKEHDNSSTDNNSRNDLNLPLDKKVNTISSAQKNQEQQHYKSSTNIYYSSSSNNSPKQIPNQNASSQIKSIFSQLNLPITPNSNSNKDTKRNQIMSTNKSYSFKIDEQEQLSVKGSPKSSSNNFKSRLINTSQSQKRFQEKSQYSMLSSKGLEIKPHSNNSLHNKQEVVLKKTTISFNGKVKCPSFSSSHNHRQINSISLFLQYNKQSPYI